MQAEISALFPGQFRLVPEGSLHLTLAFLGEIDAGQRDVLTQALRKVPFEPLALTMDHLFAFPTRGRIRGVAAGLAGSGDVHGRLLQERVRAACADGGHSTESVSLHVTLTRASRSHVADNLGLRQALDRLSVDPESFTVTSFELVRSHLEPAGSRYETLESFGARP